MPIYSSIYAFPWLFLLIILIFFYFNEKRVFHIFPIKQSQILSCVVLILFFGFRGHLNTDFISYYPFYQKLPTITNLSTTDSSFEFGFVIYSSIIKTIFPNYFIYVFINTLIDFIILFKVFRRYSSSIILSFILFITFSGISFETNLYRNIKGLECFLLSLPYLQKKQFFPYLIINLLGCTFHLSSICYILFYLFFLINLPHFLIWSGLIVSNIIFFLHINLSENVNVILAYFDLFFPHENSFEEKAILWQTIDGYGEAYGFSIGWFERSFFYIFLLSNYKKLISMNHINKTLLNSYFYYYILFMMLSPLSSAIMERLSLLFAFSYWIIIPNALAEIIKNKNNQRIFIVGLLLLCSMKIYQSTHRLDMKYDNILLNGMTDDYERKKYLSQKVLDHEK